MKKNQILPVLGAGEDGAAAGQQHSQRASHRASRNSQQHLAVSTRTTRQVPPRIHVVCPLLPCPGSEHPGEPASRHSPHPGTASCHASICTLSCLEHFIWTDAGSKITLLAQIPHWGPPPRCHPPQIMRLGLPGFQTGFSKMGRLQALGCPPFHEEIISDCHRGATAGEA